VNTPLIADGAPRAQRRAPALGEDTAELLGELGLDDQEISELLDDHVVCAGAE
jgi:crotonobetainyl-CoA:carnitine CoA-transferase CaiB-like acyl-CoA transferase